MSAELGPQAGQLGRRAVVPNLLDTRLHDHLIIGNRTFRWVSLGQRGGL